MEQNLCTMFMNNLQIKKKYLASFYGFMNAARAECNTQAPRPIRGQYPGHVITQAPGCNSYKEPSASKK